MSAPIIVAHRGLHHTAPENSHGAFRAAWQTGISWCECDVRFDRLAVPYVIHDATLDRMTNATGPLSSLDWRQINEFWLRDSTGSLTTEKIPTLKAIADYMPLKCGLLVEVKERIPVQAHLPAMLARQTWMFQSFDQDEVERVTEQKRWGKRYDIPTALLVESEAVEVSIGCRCDAMHYRHEMLDAALVSTTRKVGKRIGVWTANLEADIRRVLSLGIDMLITDEPLLAQRLIHECDGEA